MVKKYGNFDCGNKTPSKMGKTPEQKNNVIRIEVRLLKKQKRAAKVFIGLIRYV